MFPIIPANSVTAADPANDEGIFYGGWTGSVQGMSNLISNIGVLSSDVAAVASGRIYPGGTQYGNDKGIFGFGTDASGDDGTTNLVSNTGVIASDTAAVGTARKEIAAATYGADKGIFAWGNEGGTQIDQGNLVSNTGVVASDHTMVGTKKVSYWSCEFSGDQDKGIFGYGYDPLSPDDPPYFDGSNIVGNTGVVESDVTNTGTARNNISGCSYGSDKGICAYGHAGYAADVNTRNLISNVGVVADDASGIGTIRTRSGACEYGEDKGIFLMGSKVSARLDETNLVSNTGVVAADVSGVGTARTGGTGLSFN